MQFRSESNCEGLVGARALSRLRTYWPLGYVIESGGQQWNWLGPIIQVNIKFRLLESSILLTCKVLKNNCVFYQSKEQQNCQDEEHTSGAVTEPIKHIFSIT